MEDFSPTTIDQTDVLITNSTPLIDVEEEDPELSKPLLLVGYSPIIVVTVVGNLLVIIAYCRYDQVRSVPTNALIFSLSISDFLVGLFVLTINLVWVHKGYWLFGELFCRLWSALDYTVTYMSTLAIILISFDRLIMVRSGSRYQVVWTRRRAVCASATAWLFSAVLFTTVAFAMSNYDLVDFREECELEFVYNVPFSVALLVLEFAIPFPIIVISNLWVYVEIYKRSKRLGRVKRDLNVHSVDLRSSTWPTDTVAPVDIAGASGQESCSGRNRPLPPPSISRKVAAGDAVGATGVIRTSVPQPTATAGKEQIESLRYRQRQLSRHRKAAITLCILVGTFVTCWLPYEIVSIRQAMCGEDDCFSEVVWEAVNGLLWCNSALNPILYGLTNPQLRRHMLACLRPPRTVRPL